MKVADQYSENINFVLSATWVTEYSARNTDSGLIGRKTLFCYGGEPTKPTRVARRLTG
jgi:hypothetical protein